MRRDYRKTKLFNRRAVILAAIKSFLSGILLLRLGHLQVFKYKEYTTRSDKNRIKAIIQPALRGIVFDRKGKALVQNKQNYRLLVYLENKSNMAKTISKLSQIIGLDKKSESELLERISAAKNRSIISLINNLSWNDVAKIEVNSYHLPQLSIESAPIRYYPFALESSHIIGYVSAVDEKDINEKNQSLFMHPNFKVGKSGIEKSFDQYLRGKFGIKYSEVDAFGLPIRSVSNTPSIPGNNLNLTIDIDLQKFIFDKIADKVASVVVMDVKTGEIISMNSSPSFDNNSFVEGFGQEYWSSLVNNDGKPLNNKALSANYPPGSVFKLIVALLALSKGFDPKTKFKCNGKHRVGNRTFHCWKDSGHGKINMHDAIKHSCNVYFFNLAKSLDIDDISKMASKFGYGQAFDVDLQEVKSAPLPSNALKRKLLNESWVGGDTMNASIGQGFVLASPIQMAVATARIANGGIAIKPHLVKNSKSYQQYDELKSKTIVNPEDIKYIKDAMYSVVNEKKGTAYESRTRDDNFKFSGKTGTAQVISKRSKNEDIELKKRNHAIFTGFAPSNDPKYAVSIVVEHGGSGSGVAAPLAKAIFDKLKSYQ